MIRLLTTASLLADPVQRVSVKGSTYVTFSIFTECGSVSCIVFDADAQAEVMRLRKGDSLSVTGKAELRAWTDKQGAQRTSLGCTVDRVMTAAATAKPKERKREPAPAKEEPPPLAAWPAGTNVMTIPSDKPF